MADDPLSSAANALNDFANGPVLNAAGAIEQAVNRSFNAVSNTIARAALSGRDSISQLTASVLADFDRIAASQFIVKPIEGIAASLAGSLLSSIAGARATGGPVMPGASYLVGEHGPELFTPAGSGGITPNAALTTRGGNVTVNITTPDAAGFQKSRSQVAAMLARAIAQGQRNL